MKQYPNAFPIDRELTPAEVFGEPARRDPARWTLRAITFLFVALILIAALVPIGSAVLGSGQLDAESRVKRIAHPTGGVISLLAVRDGEHVKRGDLLVRLDTTVMGVRASLSGRTVDQLIAQRARLEAEREGLERIGFPASLLARRDDSARDAVASERRLFALRASERRGLRQQAYERVEQLRQQIRGYRAQIAALHQQQVLIEPELNGLEDLWRKRLVTIGRRNELKRTAVEMSGSVAALQASIAQTAARISEAREQIIQVDQAARSQAGTELTELNTALNEQQVQNATAQDQYDRSAIRAPYDGIVDSLAFSAVGDVVQPAETIMTIVPDSDRLVVEARIQPTDIDRVSVGQPARVRFSAFNSTATPEATGKVAFVAAERTTDRQTGQAYYRVRIAVDGNAVRQEHLQLLQGMPAEVFISSGSRSMLSYLTKPLADQFARAFRD